MADPRPLTRKELAEFLPNQRSIKAFEKLFDIVPAEIITNSNNDSGLGLVSLQNAASTKFGNYPLITTDSDFTSFTNSFINVTAQCVITLNPNPDEGEQIIVHKNTGLNNDYIDVTDGIGTDRLGVDQTVLSYRYSIELEQWIRGG